MSLIQTLKQKEIEERPKLHQIDGLEQRFIDYCLDSTIERKTTAEQYWNYTKTLHFMSLRHDHKLDIAGRMQERIDTQNKMNAHRKIIKFMFYIEKRQVSGRDLMELKDKRNQLLDLLELPEGKQTDKREMIEKIEKNYIPPERIVDIIREAPPKLARFYLIMYYTGCRIGEVKRMKKEFLTEPGEDGYEHGAIHIPRDRSKSVFSRKVEFLNPTTYGLIKNAPTGEFVDDNEDLWKEVLFPERDRKKEAYKLGHDKYGICPQLGIGGRSSHSFRHSRITHLVYDDSEFDLALNDIRIRSGHKNIQMTNYYTETSFQKKPKTLEEHCEENDIDILKLMKMRS